MRRHWLLVVMVVLFLVAALSDFAQVAAVLAGRTHQPRSLAALHALTGIAATAAAIALWRGLRRAPAIIWAWGVLCALMLLWVPIVLELPREAVPGLVASAAGTLAIAGLAAVGAKRLLPVAARAS